MSTEIISPRHAAARAYAAAGIPVFPCQVNGKRPACEHGYKDATTDFGQIDAWWSAADYNVAFEPETAGWCVIDIDNGEGKNGEENWRTVGLGLDTYTVVTPRGGKHLYYRGSLPPTASKLTKDVDTRGRGSYVLIPPSVVDGKPYTVLDDRDIAELPAGLAALIAKPATEAKASVRDLDLPGSIDRGRSLLALLVKRGDVAIEFRGGNDRTYRLACELLNLGLSPEKSGELLEEIWNPHCQPPWDDDALREIIDHASRYSQNEDGAWAVGSAESVFGDNPILQRMTEPARRSRFHHMDEAEQNEVREPTWLLQGLIPDETSILAAGSKGSYKTGIGTEIAFAVAANVETFGLMPVRSGPVAYWTNEGEQAIAKLRRPAWRMGHGMELIEPKIPFWLAPAPHLINRGQIEEAMGELKRMEDKAGRGTTLIVIDTYAKVVGGMKEDNETAGIYNDFVKELIGTFKCSVLTLSHKNKAGDIQARGGAALEDGHSTILDVDGSRSQGTVAVTVRYHKDASEPVKPWTFKIRELGKSFLLVPIALEEHLKAKAENDPFDAHKIGAALVRLNAYGPAAGVTGVVVATQLVGTAEFQSEEDRQAAIAEVAKRLRALSKDKLKAYCPVGDRWYLPAKSTA